MSPYTSSDIRNVTFVGHGGCGKTTLCDQILFKAGAVSRAGSVEEKNSIFDFEDEEKERQISIYTALAFCTHQGREINLIDAPGYLDFVGAATGALRAADTAILVISAPNGIELNTRRMWTAARALGMPVVIVITKMDAENILDYAGLLERLRETFSPQCLPVNLPIGTGSAFQGVIDLVALPAEVPSGVPVDARDAHRTLIERVVESDEALMERYLNEETLAPEEVSAALRKLFGQGAIVPILHCSGRTGAGVKELMDFITTYVPSPLEAKRFVARDAKSGEEVALTGDPQAPFVAQVWKSVTDPFVGKMTFFRIFQGEIAADSQVHNPRTGRNERIAHLLRVFGKETRQVERGVAGDILAVAKVEDVQIGDTLCSPNGPALVMPPIEFPTPMASVALEPKTRGDEQKISTSLRKVVDEDPTCKFARDQQTGELVLTGMSQLHLDVILKRLESRFGVSVNTKPPRIPYKETITVPSEGMYRHKKQTGGRGQFAEVWFKLEPLERGAGYEFVDEIVGGAIPHQYIPAVDKGVRETLARGVLAGYPVVDVRVRLHFGKFHEVDSSEAAFKLAASMCFQECFMKAKPVLLEPIVNLEISVPSQYMGDITGDINSRRGRIIGMDSAGDMQIIRAQVPMAEVMNYSTELRSMTGGTGSYTMEYSHLDVVPARIAEQVIARAKQEKEK